MDYNDFKYKAVVDFIDIRVTLREPSHVSHMRANEEGKGYTGLDWVAAVNKDAGGAATVFDLRIQDPRRYSDVQAVLKRLERFKPLACAPVVRCIEVSLDAYPLSPQTPPEELAGFVVNMTGWHQYPAGDRRVYDRCFRETPFQRHSAIRLVSEGCMVGMGHKKSDHYQRAYYKTTDKAGKVELAPKQRRVRFENNYSGRALPVTTLADLSAFRFETLANRGFSFRALKDGHGNGIAEEASRAYTLPVGAVKPRRSLTPRGRTVWRNSGRLTGATLPLNEKARQALRNLTGRWSKRNATETPHKRQQEATENCNAKTSATDTAGEHLSSFSVGFLQNARYFMPVWGQCPSNLLSIYSPLSTLRAGRPVPSITQSRFIPLEINRILEGVRQKFFPYQGFRTFKARCGERYKGLQGHFVVSIVVAGLQSFKPPMRPFSPKQGAATSYRSNSLCRLFHAVCR